MLNSQEGKIEFSMRKFDNGVESLILMALFGAITPEIDSSEQTGTLYFVGDTLNILKEYQIGSQFFIFIKNASATNSHLEKANELLLNALDFLKNENILNDITSEYKMRDQSFIFNITLRFNNKTEYRTLEINTLEKIYKLI